MASVESRFESEPTVAVVGGGFMAEVHSRAIRAAGGRLAGVASSSPGSAESAAGRLGFDRAFPSVDALLEDDTIDVVHVCTPNTSHAAIAGAVIQSGKHVICEKPLAVSVPEAEALVEELAGSSQRSAVPFVYRYHPMVREARDRLSSDDFGPTLSIQGSYLQDWLLTSGDDNWRVDAALGGNSRAFADIGSHLGDLIEFVTADRISRLTAVKRTVFRDRSRHRDITTEDLVAVAFSTAGGALGTMLVSQVAPGRKNRLLIEVSGGGESVVFDQEHPESLWLGRRSGSISLQRDPSQLGPDASRLSVLPPGHPQGYQDAFNAFVADAYRSMAGADAPGLPTFTDGLRSVRLTEAVMESAEKETWIEVDSAMSIKAVTT